MSNEPLLFIMLGVCLICLELEKRVAWAVHVSGVCLIILTGLLLSTAKVIPTEHALYDFFSGPVISTAIILLILALDLRHVWQLPRKLLLIFGIGALGSMFGGLVAAFFAAPTLGEIAPKLAAQLAASYIGGSENAVAMQKMFDIPNEYFVACFAVDNLLTTFWMVITLLLARGIPERPNVTPTTVKVENVSHDLPALISDGYPTTMTDVLFTVSLALSISFLSKTLHEITWLGWIHPILILSVLSLVLGQIHYIRSRIKPAYLVGTLLFAPFFFSIGAISDIRAIAKLPLAVVAMPFIVVGIHGALIYMAARLLKVSSGETSLASQALVGGPATAIALAQAKRWEAGIAMGLVLGLLGYAIANYCGAFVHYCSTILLSFFL